MYIIDLTGHMDTKKQNRYEYYQNITSHLPYVLTGCLALGFYGFFFPKHDESNYEQICFQIIGGLTITAAVFTIQKFCVQRKSASHRHIYLTNETTQSLQSNFIAQHMTSASTPASISWKLLTP